MSDDLPRNEQLVEAPAPTDQRLWSVTTIIDQSSNNRGLVEWAAGETAKAAIAGRKTLDAMLDEQGPEAAVKWLVDARERPRKGERTSKQLGSEVHRACETYALTGTKPEVDGEVRPFLEQFDRWCQIYQPEYEAAEMTVYHPDYRYAGTLDAILRVGDARVLTDYKSSKQNLDARGNLKRPYADVALQLSAYRYAKFAGPWRTRRYSYYGRRYYLLGPDELADAVPIPEVDGGMVLFLTPERCEAYRVTCDEPIFEQFRYTIRRARWSLEMSKTVIGDVLRAPQEIVERRVA